MDVGDGAAQAVQQPAAADTGAYDPSLDQGNPYAADLPADTIAATAIQPAFTDPALATTAIAITPTDIANSEASLTQADATTILPTSAIDSDSLAVSSAVTSASQPSSVFSSTTSPPATSSPAINDKSNGNGMHFKITYLIPVFVLLGLLLLLAVGGKIWGRVSFAKERAMKRNERRRQEAQQIANETRNAYMQPWQEKGWGGFDASMEMQRNGQDVSDDDEDDGGDRKDTGVNASPSKYGVQLYDGPAPYRCNDSDGDASEHDLRGPLSAIGTHLAGQRFGQRAPPPPARMEHDRFKPQLAANSWWSVQWSRHFGGNGGGSGSYDGLENLHADQQKSSAATAARWVANQQVDDARLAAQIQRRRTTKRGMLARMKSRLGWGYDGSSPLLGARRGTHAFVMPPQAPMYWSRIPQAEDELAGDPSQPACEQWPQPYGRPMDEEPNLNRTLPPTPMTAIDTPTPLARKRIQDVRAFELNRAQTHSTVSSIKRTANVKTVGRSSTVAASRGRSTASSSRAALEDSEAEKEEVVRRVRQIKSLNSMANVASASDRESALSKASTLQRHKTMGPLKSAPKKVNVAVASGQMQDIRRQGDVRNTRGSFKRQTMRKPVNFGDYSDEEDDDNNKENLRGSTGLPALDSFLLSRSKSVKSNAGSMKKDQRGVGMILSDYEGSDIFSPETDGEVIMDLGRKYSTNYSETSAVSSIPALSRGSTMTQSSASSRESDSDGPTLPRIKSYTPLTNTDEVGAEIDPALLNIIARSNTSKSFARSVGGFASAAASPIQRDKGITTDSNTSTPIGRTGTWRNDKGRWTRSSPTSQAANGATPADSAKSTSSPMPLPLPTPPLAALPRALLAASPSRRSTNSLAKMQDGNVRRDSALTLSSSSQGHAISQRSSKQSMHQLSQVGQTQKFGTSHAKIGRDLFFTQSDDPARSVKEALLAEVRRSAAASAASSSRTPTERSQSTRSSVFSSETASSAGRSTQSSTLLTESDVAGPLARRATIAKRTSPTRYTAKLASGDDERYYDDDDDEYDPLNKVAANYKRLHTGKSQRTPAEKRRDQTYAMDRVQSIVTRATLARANQPEPALWLDA